MPTCPCGHVFTEGELRYRADDGRDYCITCGTPIWRAEAGSSN
jgi:hypothetical protein